MDRETTIIEELKAAFPGYIGDDAAILPTIEGKASYLISKDLLIEEIHFRTNYFHPNDLAHKALQVNLSDIAAMGAIPVAILCGIAIPLQQLDYAHHLLRYLIDHCTKAELAWIGGDIVASPTQLMLSITAIGKATHITYRTTAQVGDCICVAGNLGYAHLGLVAHEQSLPGFEIYKNALLRPYAKIAEGQWLATKVNTMMDLSDGLYIDLKRLCNASHVKAVIELERLEPTAHFVAACRAMQLDPVETMLIGGEDYGLLCTINYNSYKEVKDIFQLHFGYPLLPIGYITTGHDLHFTYDGLPKQLNLQPFSHFKSTSVQN